MLVGACGWGHQEWVGQFYPNNKVAKLPYYAKIFNSVEVDSSFYKAPSKSMITGWIKSTPPGFKFSMQIPKSITHNWIAEKEFQSFLQLVEPMVKVDKLGCLLAIMPSEFSIDSLQSLLELTPAHINIAVEFRDGVQNKEAISLIKKYNVAIATDDEPALTISHSYVRLHKREYSDNELQSIVSKLANTEIPTYLYFVNRSSVLGNLLRFLELHGQLTEERLKAKKRLERYAKKHARVA